MLLLETGDAAVAHGAIADGVGTVVAVAVFRTNPLGGAEGLLELADLVLVLAQRLASLLRVVVACLLEAGDADDGLGLLLGGRTVGGAGETHPAVDPATETVDAVALRGAVGVRVALDRRDVVAITALDDEGMADLADGRVVDVADVAGLGSRDLAATGLVPVQRRRRVRRVRDDGGRDPGLACAPGNEDVAPGGGQKYLVAHHVGVPGGVLGGVVPVAVAVPAFTDADLCAGDLEELGCARHVRPP